MDGTTGAGRKVDGGLKLGHQQLRAVSSTSTHEGGAWNKLGCVRSLPYSQSVTEESVSEKIHHSFS